jgi:hypothetical protein
MPKGIYKHNSSWNKGIPMSEKHKEKIRLSQTGKKHKPESIEKMRISHLGDKNPMFGKYGKLASNWRGGKSFEPYNPRFNKKFKRKIRKRFNFICELCGKCADNVHHIDYNKKNCRNDNLILLCRGCHAKTNFNRDYWIKYFMTLIKK